MSDGTGYVARVADSIEAAQLGSAADLTEEALRVLAECTWTPGEIHLLAVELTASLIDVRRIAESRGARLPAPDHDPDMGATGREHPQTMP
ncbi:hypothetical protein [Streptomyces decoyicus]|uniref:hypothetical protein n=1 Tax=Streptomyces decoyicus TaxID=249567 RepID=UPI0038694824